MRENKLYSITESGSKQEHFAKLMQAEIKRNDEKALREILGNESGRWFLMRLLDFTKVNQSCFTGNSHTFYNEGKREVGLEILRMITDLGIDGVKLKQTAELEYIQTQLRAQEIAADYMKGENEDG